MTEKPAKTGGRPRSKRIPRRKRGESEEKFQKRLESYYQQRDKKRERDAIRQRYKALLDKSVKGDRQARVELFDLRAQLRQSDDPALVKLSDRITWEHSDALRVARAKAEAERDMWRLDTLCRIREDLYGTNSGKSSNDCGVLTLNVDKKEYKIPRNDDLILEKSSKIDNLSPIDKAKMALSALKGKNCTEKANNTEEIDSKSKVPKPPLSDSRDSQRKMRLTVSKYMISLARVRENTCSAPLNPLQHPLRVSPHIPLKGYGGGTHSQGGCSDGGIRGALEVSTSGNESKVAEEKNFPRASNREETSLHKQNPEEKAVQLNENKDKNRARAQFLKAGPAPILSPIGPVTQMLLLWVWTRRVLELGALCATAKMGPGQCELCFDAYQHCRSLFGERGLESTDIVHWPDVSLSLMRRLGFEAAAHVDVLGSDPVGYMARWILAERPDERLLAEARSLPCESLAVETLFDSLVFSAVRRGRVGIVDDG